MRKAASEWATSVNLLSYIDMHRPVHLYFNFLLFIFYSILPQEVRYRVFPSWSSTERGNLRLTEEQGQIVSLLYCWSIIYIRNTQGQTYYELIEHVIETLPRTATKSFIRLAGTWPFVCYPESLLLAEYFQREFQFQLKVSVNFYLP